MTGRIEFAIPTPDGVKYCIDVKEFKQVYIYDPKDLTKPERIYTYGVKNTKPRRARLILPPLIEPEKDLK